MDTTTIKDNGGENVNEKDKKAIEKTTKETFAELVNRTNRKNPSPTDVEALRRMLRECPSVWGSAEFAFSTALNMIQSVKATSGVRELMEHSYRQLSNDLGHDRASPLEKALIEHLALVWLRLYVVEQGYTQKTMSDERCSLTLADYWDRRLSAAQQRYLRACETLVRVRKLHVPALQMNIAAAGGQQVNVAGS